MIHQNLLVCDKPLYLHWMEKCKQIVMVWRANQTVTGRLLTTIYTCNLSNIWIYETIAIDKICDLYEILT